jgi:hypothetical protein
LLKLAFYKPAKQIKRQHVKNQVHKIGMYQPAGNKAVPLPLPVYCGRIKDQVIDYFLVAERGKRNNTGNDNNDEGYGKHECLIIAYL